VKDLIVIMACTSPQGTMHKYLQQLYDAGIESYVDTIKDFDAVNNIGGQIAAVRRLTKQFSDYEKIVFTDAFDVLFYGTKEDVLGKIGDHVILPGERNCWPDPSLALYMPGETPWKFVNGGLLAGRPAVILDWLDKLEQHSTYHPKANNQGWFNLLKSLGCPLITVDEKTELFYCLFNENDELQMEGDRPVNSVFGTHPNFIHANGKSLVPASITKGDPSFPVRGLLGSVAVCIGLPFSGRPVPPEFALTFASQNYPLNSRRAYYAIKGKEVGEAREEIAEMAVKDRAKYLWFPDDDMSFPGNACRLLMAEMDQAADDVMVIGGVYCSKSVPAEPLVYRGEGQGAFWKWKLGDIFEVSSLGTGCMLIDVKKLPKLPKPWFKTIDGPQKQSDDLYFCQKVREAGFKILCHGGITCGHFLYDELKREFTPYLLDPKSYPMRPVTEKEPRCAREMEIPVEVA
jgi:hypothetical protein